MAHQDRVLVERDDLISKLAKLRLFIETPVFATLPPDEQFRLLMQADVMGLYVRILDERIQAFQA
jgi:hypothetical protein